ncbi:SURF1 family protein [Nocardiopsis coralliicola]
MLAFHALVAVVVPSFIWLGFWQLHRWEEKSAAVELQERNIAAEPVPVEELSGPGDPIGSDERWRRATATGTFDAEHELLVRNRDGSAGVGLHVLTPLVTEDGAALLVNRGWVEQPPTSAEQPDVPPPPAGEVTVTARMQVPETPESTGIRDRGGLPEGQVMLVDVDTIADGLPYPVFGSYGELTEQSPPSDPAPEPVPEPETNLGMNASYAFQWWVFSGVAVVGWFFLMRRELRDAAEAAGSADGTAANAPAAEPAPSGPPPGG